jgi:hypothetical protein
LATKLQTYLDAEPRIEHGPHGLEETAADREQLDAARREASRAIVSATPEAGSEQASLINAAERFLSAEAALRACEEEHLPRLERLSRELARVRAALEEQMLKLQILPAQAGKRVGESPTGVLVRRRSDSSTLPIEERSAG